VRAVFSNPSSGGVRARVSLLNTPCGEGWSYSTVDSIYRRKRGGCSRPIHASRARADFVRVTRALTPPEKGSINCGLLGGGR
jgi:hypothetical protein